jgi:hypothetical protein
MEKSNEIKNLATALNAFQGEVSKIAKTSVNPFFKSKYASLSDILDVIREPLTNNGLSFVQFPKGKYGLETMLLHNSGEWLSESYEMKPTKEDPQGAGSVITYQRRYALGAILGLNIDEDDDGNKASEPTPQETKAKKWLNPKTPEWNEAIKFLQEGELMSKILTKYSISQANQELLISQIEL